MAYDSKTYGQSPFGNQPSPKGNGKEETVPSAPPSPAAKSKSQIDDGLDQGPDQLGLNGIPKTVSTTATPIEGPITQKQNPATRLAERIKFNLGKKTGAEVAEPETQPKTTTSRKRKSSSTAKSNTTKKSNRKSSKKSKAATAKAEAEAAEAAVAERFREEDQNAYFSLLYKTGISALVWSVLRLLKHELSEDAIAIINVIINPVLIATVALISIIALTFWLRRIVNDLAWHTRQLGIDAEVTDGKNYRPTLEIVGDSLEYNPKLRKQLSFFFDAASTLVCALISYLLTSAVFSG